MQKAPECLFRGFYFLLLAAFLLDVSRIDHLRSIA
jgi:hypothetical protein